MPLAGHPAADPARGVSRPLSAGRCRRRPSGVVDRRGRARWPLAVLAAVVVAVHRCRRSRSGCARDPAVDSIDAVVGSSTRRRRSSHAGPRRVTSTPTPSLLRIHQGAARRLAAGRVRSPGDADEVGPGCLRQGVGRPRLGSAPSSPFRPWLLAHRRQRGPQPPPVGRPAGRLRAAIRRATGPSGGAAPSPEAAVLAADRRQQTLGAALAEPAHAAERTWWPAATSSGSSEAETAAVAGPAAGHREVTGRAGSGAAARPVARAPSRSAEPGDA